MSKISSMSNVIKECGVEMLVMKIPDSSSLFIFKDDIIQWVYVRLVDRKQMTMVRYSQA